MSLNSKLAMAALAGLLTAGVSASPALATTHDAGHETAAPEKHGSPTHEIEKHACKGQNSCKGNGGCKTEKNACKGQNECKGHGGCRTDGGKMP